MINTNMWFWNKLLWNLHAARWDSCQNGDSNRPHRTCPPDCKRGHISVFSRTKNLPFWHCLQLQLFNPPESPKVITSLVHEALESRIDVSHGNGKAFLSSSWLLLGWVADVFTSWLIFTFLSAICSLSREFFHELCGTLSSIVDSYSNIQVCTSFYILAPAAITAAQPHAVHGWLSHNLFKLCSLLREQCRLRTIL